MADLVLLTGISGFLGGHVAFELLNQGFAVRGSVRSLDKADKVRATLKQAGADVSRLEFVALDLNADAGWDDAMAGVRYLQHTASPFVTNMPKDKMELIRPAVDGTRRALTAALKANVERVVVTSSMAAVAYGHPASRTAPFTAADWTDLHGRGVNAYIESKALAEKEAWTIMDSAGRHDDLAVINPNAIMGPLLDEDPGTSAALIARLMNGSIPAAARIYFAVIDVRDVAVAQVRAMLAPEAGGHRFPMGERTLSFIDFANVIRDGLPEFAKKLPTRTVPDWMVKLFSFADKDIRGNVGELGIIRHTDSSDVVALLGRPLIPSADSVIATAKSLVAHGVVARP
ncbi:MAG: aldehyde reductase [Devosia sp.]